MKKRLFFIPAAILLFAGMIYAQNLPMAFQKHITAVVNELYPNAAIKSENGSKTIFSITVGGKAVGTLYLLTGEGPADNFEFMTILDKEKVVKRVEVLKYVSKFGTEVTKRTWLKKFEGKKAGEIKAEKDVDIVSGATISCNEILQRINKLNETKK